MTDELRRVSDVLEANQSMVQRQVFDQYYDRLVQLVRNQMTDRLAQRVGASDVAISAFRSFFDRAGKGEFTFAARTDMWKLLVTMTLNKMRHQVRFHQAKKRAVESERANENLLAGAPTRLPGPVDLAILNDEMESVLGCLKPYHREIGERILAGQPSADIAFATDRSVRTVRRVESSLLVMLDERLHGDSSPETSSKA
ncbi:MAG: ECF-type sigma factor [Planctomycetota bacterium]